MKTEFDPTEIQGNILRGYKSSHVRHLILEVPKRTGAAQAARRFLGIAARGGAESEVPAITRESRLRWSRDPDVERPKVRFNVGLTWEGLRALGAPTSTLASFPREFREGMHRRALKLGDFGASAPENWPTPFNRPDRVHVIASVYAEDEAHLDDVQAQVGRAFGVLGQRCGYGLPDFKVRFGYRDSIAQPRFEEIVKYDREGEAGDANAASASADPDGQRESEPLDPLGTVLLGYPTRLERLTFDLPQPDVLGYNGSFNAFRVLAQDVHGFENYLTEAAEELLRELPEEKLLGPGEEAEIRALFNEPLSRREVVREIVAAQMCGRWRDALGTPLAEVTGPPPEPGPNGEPPVRNDFDYGPRSRCPFGAHIRRANPRGGQIVQRIANRTRRLVRRGMVYGEPFAYERDQPCTPDIHERGLLGNFIGANLGAQFEAVMCDWINLGLQDPNVTGSNDALIGANVRETSWFDVLLKDNSTYRLRGFPRFVTTRGGAYTFLPSIPALRHIAAWG